MSYKYSVLLAGSGETSRANVEALMEDHYHANGNSGLVVIAFHDRPSSGQIWAGQVASSKNLEIVIVSPPNGNFDSLPRSSCVFSDTPYEDAVRLVKSAESPEAFLFWSDDDPGSMEALAFCKREGVPALDLCNGLVEITPSTSLEPTPVVEMPAQELQTTPEKDLEDPVEKDEEDEEGDDEEESSESEEDEEYEEGEVGDVLYAALNALAAVIADIVVERLKERDK